MNINVNLLADSSCCFYGYLYIDDASADSCLILVLLCMVTVVISIGGTALYCLLGNGGTAVCTDFSQNMDVYWGPVRSGVGWLTHWLFPVS